MSHLSRPKYQTLGLHYRSLEISGGHRGGTSFIYSLCEGHAMRAGGKLKKVFFTAVPPSTKHVWSTTKSPSLTVSCPEPLCHFSFGMTENMSWSSLIILWIKLTKSCRVQNISQGRLGKLGYKNKIWDPESGKVMNQQLKSTGET